MKNKHPQTWKDKVPEEEVSKAVEDVYGYGDGDGKIMTKYGLDLAEVDEMMLDNGYERCKSCRNWTECGELVDEHGDVTTCDQCK